MYAIVEIAGQQFKVEKDQKLFVHRLAAAEGDSVSFDKILLIDNDGQVNIGTPTIEAATISAKILKHLKGDKVIVFKKKRRKGYAVKNGHRQQFTQIQIEAINATGEKKKRATKKEVVAETESVEAV
jgi:ribosomal protein L21